MPSFASKNKHLSSRSNKWRDFSVTLLGLIILAGISWPLFKKTVKKRQLDNEIAANQAELKQLGQKNQELNELLDFLSSEAFVEKEARTNLNMLKDGEEKLVIKGLPEQDGSEIPNKMIIDRPHSTQARGVFVNLGLWFDYFLKPKQS